jgi:hypothetical protein
LSGDELSGEDLICEELTVSHADDLQLYTFDLEEDMDTLVRLVNEDLERISR